MNWQLDNIPNVCDENQKQKFICIHTQTFFTSSVIWGTFGPAKMYGPRGLYHLTLYGFLVGAILPVPFYLLSRWKYRELRHVYSPTLLLGGLLWAPRNLTWITPCIYLGYLFNVYIKRRYFSWWATYNVSIPLFDTLIMPLVHHFISFDTWLRYRYSICILRSPVSRY